MFRRRLTILAALLGLTAVGLAQPASAAESWPIPPTATITFEGNGHGHGRGLSQYGAENAARQGATYAEIVEHYYPGTSWGKATGPVRVFISNDLTSDVRVAARKGLVARKVGGGASWKLTQAKKNATSWRINPAGANASVLQYYARGWRTFKKVSGGLEFTAGNQPTSLYVNGGRVDYRGVLRSVPVPGKPANRITVNILPMETYLRGVVPAETYASTWHQQTLRAQAVAARSYAAYQRIARKAKLYDLCDTASCQVYGGATVEYPTTDRAVQGTAGRILTYAGKPAFTEFSASSGGWTTAGDFPYLVAMEDTFQATDDDVDPNYHWRAGFTDAELEAEWPQLGDLTAIELDDRDGNGEWGGRVGTVTLTGDEGSVTLSGSSFRQALGLRSEWLTITVG